MAGCAAGWNRDVKNLNPVVRQKFLPGVMNLRNSSQFRRRARLPGVFGSNRHNIEAGILVSDKMNIAHDKARPNGANAIIFLARRNRQVFQIQINVHSTRSVCFARRRSLSIHLSRVAGAVILRPTAGGKHCLLFRHFSLSDRPADDSAFGRIQAARPLIYSRLPSPRETLNPEDPMKSNAVFESTFLSTWYLFFHGVMPYGDAQRQPAPQAGKSDQVTLFTAAR